MSTQEPFVLLMIQSAHCIHAVQTPKLHAGWTPPAAVFNIRYPPSGIPPEGGWFCLCSIHTDGYTIDNLDFIWKEEAPLTIKENLELPEFAIAGKDVGTCTKKFSTGKTILFPVFHALWMSFYGCFSEQLVWPLAAVVLEALLKSFNSLLDDVQWHKQNQILSAL